MSDVSVSTEAANTYNLATRGYVQALVQGHNYEPNAHSGNFTALSNRIKVLEDAAKTSSKNPTAIEIRDSFGDIVSRINADLTVDTPTGTKTLLTNTDYDTLRDRDDHLKDLIDQNHADLVEAIRHVDGVAASTTEQLNAFDQRVTAAEAETQSSIAALSDRIDIKSVQIDEAMAAHTEQVGQRLDGFSATLEGFDGRITAIDEHASTNSNDIAALGQRVTQLESHDESADTDISQAQTDIAQNRSDIESLGGRVATLEENRATDAANIAQAQTDIAQNQSDIVGVNGRIENLESESAQYDHEIDLAQSDLAAHGTRLYTLEQWRTTATGDITTAKSDIATLKGTATQHTADISSLRTKDAVHDEEIEALGNTVQQQGESINQQGIDIGNNAEAILKKQDAVNFSNDFAYTENPTGGHDLSLQYGTVTESNNRAVSGGAVYSAINTQGAAVATDAANTAAEAKVEEMLSTFTEETSGPFMEATSGAFAENLIPTVTENVSGDVSRAVKEEFAPFIPVIVMRTWTDTVVGE